MLHRIAVSGLLYVVAVGLSWNRMSVTSRSLLWADDGVFLTDALSSANPFGILLKPYAGYLHFTPRLIAAITVEFGSVADFPTVVTLLSLMVSSAVAVLIYRLARHQGLGVATGLALYALTFLAPALCTEVIGNIANLHWFFLWLAPWLFLARPQRGGPALILAVVALIAGLTEIQMLLFLPLVLWRPRSDHRWWLLSAALIGAFSQVITTVLSPRSDHGFALSLDSTVVTVHGFIAQVGASIWTTRLPSPQFIALVGWIGLAALYLLPSAAAGIWILTATRRHRMLAAALGCGALVTWTAATVANNLPGTSALVLLSNLAPNTRDVLLRHAVTPAWMLAALLPIAADVLLVRRQMLPRLLAGSLILALLTAWILAYPDNSGSRRVYETSWSDEITSAVQECRSGKAEHAELGIPPGGNWALTVSCERLLR